MIHYYPTITGSLETLIWTQTDPYSLHEHVMLLISAATWEMDIGGEAAHPAATPSEVPQSSPLTNEFLRNPTAEHIFSFKWDKYFC